MPQTALIEPGPAAAVPSMGTRLVVLMYDGAIGALDKALAAIERGDLETRCNCVNMTMDILAKLSEALDHEQGGQVARNLDNLYDFMLARLMRTNLTNDPQPAREVLRMLNVLYEAWRTLDERVTAEALSHVVASQTPEMRAAG